MAYEPTVSRGSVGFPSGSVAVLMPGRHAAVQADYVGRTGGTRRVEAIPPMVTVFSAQERVDLEGTGEMLTLMLDSEIVATRAPRLNGQRAGLVAMDPYLRRLGETMMIGFRKSVAPSAGFLSAIAGRIADHLNANYAAPDGRSPGGLAPHRLERLKTLVAQRLADSLRVEELADAICMSPFHFARMFRESTGETPHAYVTRVRIEEAKRLLSETRMPLAEIAVQTGFRTQAHFTGVFHLHAGITPRAYRMASASQQD